MRAGFPLSTAKLEMQNCEQWPLRSEIILPLIVDCSGSSNKEIIKSGRIIMCAGWIVDSRFKITAFKRMFEETSKMNTLRISAT